MHRGKCFCDKGSPRQIILDLDATDDLLHRYQEGRRFHVYHDCYCYLPLYMFCGRHLLVAKLRRSNIDASAREVEEVARVVREFANAGRVFAFLLRGDSGFAREELMAWCEANRVDFLFGLPRNERLQAAVARELAAAKAEAEDTSKSARWFRAYLVYPAKLEPLSPGSWQS